MKKLHACALLFTAVLFAFGLAGCASQAKTFWDGASELSCTNADGEALSVSYAQAASSDLTEEAIADWYKQEIVPNADKYDYFIVKYSDVDGECAVAESYGGGDGGAYAAVKVHMLMQGDVNSGTLPEFRTTDNSVCYTEDANGNLTVVWEGDTDNGTGFSCCSVNG